MPPGLRGTIGGRGDQPVKMAVKKSEARKGAGWRRGRPPLREPGTPVIGVGRSSAHQNITPSKANAETGMYRSATAEAAPSQRGHWRQPYTFDLAGCRVILADY